MVELIEQSRMAVEELIDCVGRVTIQAILMASAEQVAGPRWKRRKSMTGEGKRKAGFPGM